MEHFLVGCISRLNKAEERIDELENSSIKIAQTKTRREEIVKENKQTNKHQNGASKSCDLICGLIYM